MGKKKMYDIIVCCDSQGGISKEGRIPWKCPEDMAFFKSMTEGCIVIMGRKTWESLPKKGLPGRTCLVISRTKENCFRTLGDALKEAEKVPDLKGIFVIGGHEIYLEALNFFSDSLSLIYKSSLKECFSCDNFFPTLGKSFSKFLEIKLTLSLTIEVYEKSMKTVKYHLNSSS